MGISSLSAACASVRTIHAASVSGASTVSSCSEGYEVHNFGTDSTEIVDYPNYAHLVCQDITENNADLGILICGTGIGMSIAANKHKGIRAGVCGDTESAKLTRMHNNSNVLCIGARITGEVLALETLDAWIYSEFQGNRHQNRIDKISKYEEERF